MLPLTRGSHALEFNKYDVQAQRHNPTPLLKWSMKWGDLLATYIDSHTQPIFPNSPILTLSFTISVQPSSSLADQGLRLLVDISWTGATLSSWIFIWQLLLLNSGQIHNRIMDLINKWGVYCSMTQLMLMWYPLFSGQSPEHLQVTLSTILSMSLQRQQAKTTIVWNAHIRALKVW